MSTAPPSLGVTVELLRVRDFRAYRAAEIRLGAGLTVIFGPNGAGKTNLLEALYFGSTGRSCRTNDERQVVRFGAQAARVELSTRNRDGVHEIAVGFQPGEAKRLKVDGAPVDRLMDNPARPLVSVFLPERLDLIKGGPSGRRAHLDQVVAALWPSRAPTRKAYANALAQRNALIARIRKGAGSRSSLPTWDRELARQGVALRADRAETIAALQAPFAAAAADLGLAGAVGLEERPRDRPLTEDAFAAQLAEKLEADLERGFTLHGPHRDDLALLRAPASDEAQPLRELRSFGSQGEQRMGLLALLLAEREVLGQARGGAPLLLLDDVMSELDVTRRERLVERVRGTGGQAVITTTDLAHVPGADAPDVTRVEVREGAVVVQEEAPA